MITSQRHNSVTGEILSARKILDMHLSLRTKYYWKEELVTDVMKHSEDMIFKNVSIESLVYFWNIWKDKIVGVFESLRCLETPKVNKFKNYGEFCLNYLGVWRDFSNSNPIFSLLYPEAEWAQNIDKRSYTDPDRKNRRRSDSGKLASIELHQFVSAAQRYWCSEMLSVGVMVLDRLHGLYDFPIQNCDVIFYKSRALTLIYEVATFLLDEKLLKLRHHESESLLKYIRFSTENIVGYIFPELWKPLSKNMIVLRGTGTTESMLNLVIAESINLSNKLSFRQIGRITIQQMSAVLQREAKKLTELNKCFWRNVLFIIVRSMIRGP
ncbi:uncharacterized protein LOC133031492 [Cannabis sativa]|uniref:uncharacterized protein LOC133031492 n=1 Tax=Cannabis sativa TaxID=3483 RepID=UPI0029CAA892|nr:uncharacterized protein LOC133031492 [Cannabis sativa]